MPCGVTARRAKGQAPFREGPPPAASPAYPLTQASRDISMVGDPCAIHPRDIRETEKVGAAGQNQLRGPDGLPLCSVTEQGSSGGGPSRLRELRDILGSCSALRSAGLGVSQHWSPSECVCICGSVGGAGWGTPRLLDPGLCCSWAHRETLSTKRRLWGLLGQGLPFTMTLGEPQGPHKRREARRG